MREIKFRAWRKEVIDQDDGYVYEGEMSHSDREGSKRRVEIAGFYQDSGWDYDDFLFMQFTGLLDKNGTEIYEGDILKGDDEGNEVVVYEGNMFMLQPQNDDCVYWQLSEVIGNIHENPELVT